MSDAEFEIVNASSGASNTFPKQASAIRKNDFAMLNGFPCKITDTATSKTGKHGHAKVNFTGVDIFTNRKYEDMYPSTHNLDVPIVKKTELMATEIDADELEITLMTPEGDITIVKMLAGDENTVKLLELFKDGVPSDDVHVTIIEWNERRQVVGIRTAKPSA